MDKVIMMARIIAGSMGASVLLYAVVAEVLARNGSLAAASPREASGLFLALASLAPLFLLGAFLLRRMVLSGTIPQPRAKLSAPKPLLRLLNATTFSALMCEMVGVLGLLIFLFTADRVILYSLLVLSLAGIAFFFPRRATWEQYLAAHMDEG